jgi:hypothetical protein
MDSAAPTPSPSRRGRRLLAKKPSDCEEILLYAWRLISETAPMSCIYFGIH